jgi:hypothetical protein
MLFGGRIKRLGFGLRQTDDNATSGAILDAGLVDRDVTPVAQFLNAEDLERPPSGTEGLEPLWIGSHSLAVRPLCDLRLPALDLGSHCGCRERRAKLGFRDLRR